MTRKTPIALLHRILWVHIPNGVAYIDSCLLNGQLLRTWSRSGNYILNENHPLVLVSLQLQMSTDQLSNRLDLLRGFTRDRRVHLFATGMAADVENPSLLGPRRCSSAIFLAL